MPTPSPLYTHTESLVPWQGVESAAPGPPEEPGEESRQVRPWIGFGVAAEYRVNLEEVASDAVAETDAHQNDLKRRR